MRVKATDLGDSPEYVYMAKPVNIRWAAACKDAFCNAVKSPACRQAVSGFLQTGILPDQSSIDEATAFLTNLMKHSAKVAGMDIRKGALPRHQARPDQVRKGRPKWHDVSCQSAYRKVKLSAELLAKYPNSQYLKSKLITESKEYKKIVKSKQKLYLSGIFDQLEDTYARNPKKYMDLVRSLKSGSFDKKIPSDTGAIGPQEWIDHFQQLLGPKRPVTAHEQ